MSKKKQEQGESSTSVNEEQIAQEEPRDGGEEDRIEEARTEEPKNDETTTSHEAVNAELEGKIDELTAEVSSLKDQYLRKQADFENFRRRMQREKAETATYANQQLLLDIITIIDDFERAIKSAEESRDFDAFHDGIVMIEKQFTSMLERKWGLQRFDSDGEEFDPQKHEAVASEPAPGADSAKVAEEFQKGYMLHDRVLRSAKVKVAMPAPAEGENDSASS
ncbi:MAG: nucleotide exchange factor GrpE [Alkalispirochaetaceae bacterium]